MVELYPPNPAVVPDDLTTASKAYRRNAWLALAGLLGFVAAYLTLTGWFAYKAFTLLWDAWQGGSGAFWGFAAGLLAAFLAVFLGKALFFIAHHRDDSSVEITLEQEPALFGFVHRLADDAGAPRPHRVYLSSRVNAAVFYDLSLFNLLFPSRKNLEIGIGLVNVLTLGELKAVLAHEFGHFAQRSMAVGRWVYVGQQIAAHIVGKRDVLDGFLQGLSSMDLRVAWIGWGLRVVVWSIRSVMESLFHVVIVAERALSREMELQADRVAVSLTGSDALIHALHKLHAADEAWDHAAEILASELAAGRIAPDIFAMQARVLEHTRRVLGDETYGAVPTVPEGERASHRIFSADLAQPPQMWSTHPPNHVREENAKQRYVEAIVDERSAWLVFANPRATRQRLTEHLIRALPRPDESSAIDLDASLSAVDQRFASAHLDRRYRGAYLGRRLTRSERELTALHWRADLDPDATRAALEGLYPESLGTAVERARELVSELGQLEGLKRGVLTAPGKLIRFRGQQVRRRDLPGLIESVKQEHEEALRTLRTHDRESRAAHLSAAQHLGRGWPEYLAGLQALLHYAEHAEAEVDDAGGHLQNVTAIVTADGKVSSAEARRLIHSGADLQCVLASVYEQRQAVCLPFAVAQKLEVETWTEALPETFALPPPNEHNIADFMDAAWSWLTAFSNALGALRNAALEVLLTSEAHVARAFLEGTDPGDAYGHASVPTHYLTRCYGDERERQMKLDWWDRFMLADGIGPGATRLVLASAIIAVVVGFGSRVGTPSAVVYNGFDLDLVVSIGGEEVGVPAYGRATVDFDADDMVRVVARTRDGDRLIESFEGEVKSRMADYVYNVAGASPIVEWTAVYGDAPERPERMLGAPRWFVTDADVLFKEPPASVTTGRSNRAERRVLQGFADQPPFFVMSRLEDEAERERLVLTHARWEPADGVGARWIMLATPLPGFSDVLAERIAEGDRSVLIGRLEQDIDPDRRAEVCVRHAELADTAPQDPDRQYLAARCVDDRARQRERFSELAQRHPEHPWLALATAYDLAEGDELDAALERFELARRQLPAMAEELALVQARLHRLASPDEHQPFLTLREESLQLHVLLALERGSFEDFGVEDPMPAFAKLDQGDLEAAVASSPREDLPRVLRLTAASDGASPEMLEAVQKLGSDEGIDYDTIWSAIALSVRAGADASLLLERAETFVPDLDAMLRFTHRENMLEDLPATSQAMVRLHPALRGHAAVMGVITLGDEAPPHWRTQARRLLFASERPYIAPAPPPSE